MILVEALASKGFQSEWSLVPYDVYSINDIDVDIIAVKICLVADRLSYHIHNSIYSDLCWNWLRAQAERNSWAA